MGRAERRGSARLISERFVPPLLLRAEVAGRVPALLAEHGMAGGASYDALVALATVENEAVLATRDARARGTYELLGAHVVAAGISVQR